MKETKAILDWKKCVSASKRKFGISPTTYMVLSGKILKEAQRYYCVMGY